MKCPNCGNELVESPRYQYSAEDARRMELNLKWSGTTCDNCPAVVEIEEPQGAIAVSIISMAVWLPSVLLLAMLKLTALAVVITMSLPILIFVSIGIGIHERKAHVIKMRPKCRSCGTLLESPDTRFCAKCGATVLNGAQVKGTTEADSLFLERVGKCMVCNLDLGTKDPIAWCAHCGGIAHRVHLLEWVHVPGNCPLCKHHLDEREINKQSPAGPPSLREKKHPAR